MFMGNALGFHVAGRLIRDGVTVVGLDCINEYYDVGLKYDRLKQHGIDARESKNRDVVQSSTHPNYRFLKADLADYEFIVKFMVEEKFDYVISLAAQAGVRYSI